MTAAASLLHTGPDMNKETLQGQWKQLKGHVRKQWGKLTDDVDRFMEENRP
jgi:uncharacterized protein YjbJ (UPF0337 family)